MFFLIQIYIKQLVGIKQILKVQMKTKIIAEAGVNHNGKISLAKKMISAAASLDRLYKISGL